MTTGSLLNEPQRQHIRASCQYIDRLLDDLEHALSAAESGSPFARYVDDLSPAEKQIVREHSADLRAQMLRVLAGLAIEPGIAASSARHAVRSSLGFIEIALEEIKPQYMRGYGVMPEAAVPQLNGLVVELQALVHRVEAALEERPVANRSQRPDRLGDVPAEERVALDVVARVIDRHGLVRFRSALDAVIDHWSSPLDDGDDADEQRASRRAALDDLRRGVRDVMAQRRADDVATPTSVVDVAALERGLRQAAGLFEDVRRTCEALRNPPQRILTEALDLAADRATTALDYPESTPGGVEPAVRAAIAQTATDLADDIRRPLGVLVEQVAAAIVEASRAAHSGDSAVMHAWGGLLRAVPAFEFEDVRVDLRVAFRGLLGRNVAVARVRAAVVGQIGAQVERALRAYSLALHEWSLRVLARVRDDFTAEAARLRAHTADGAAAARLQAIDDDLAALDAAAIG